MELDTIACGDCLDVMRDMPFGGVDLVITDPPYMLGTKSSFGDKINPWADYCNAAFWYMEWIKQSRRILKQTGDLWSFLNWRSFVTFQKAACDLNWPIESVLIWDKRWIGPGGSKGLRPSYELVALWAMPDFAIPNRGLTDIWQCQWSSNKPNGHPAEKPVDLITRIISECPGELIFDPFIGSGTTAVAALKLGRHFYGCDINPEYVKLANQRIEKTRLEMSQMEMTL